LFIVFTWSQTSWDVINTIIADFGDTTMIHI
jgi:hypothetical protein